MKIIGVTYGERKSLILKGDSALLVNRKPFFIPDETQQPVAFPALALRVSRLGKHIAPRFANRYYDAVAPALDIQAVDMRAQAIANGEPWTSAVSLDGSFPLGEWTTQKANWIFWTNGTDEKKFAVTDEQIAEAVSLVSKYMTIRQGDIIFLQLNGQPLTIKLNDSLTARREGEDTDALFCRIK
ncbi:MAG: fumarylacetoacetate hydrolase family protein [Paludibacteraceae bacterium]|nr:fumarylacetoacetate hydrolase family protein [Paludibacteraceae bacterium]